MSDNSKIEWTDTTWNPTTGCTKVTPGCDNCYAETLHERFHGKGSFAVVSRSESKLYAPLAWRKPRKVFVNSMSDLFHDQVPLSFIERVFSVMARTPQHTYQLLTKRHGRMASILRRPTFPDTLSSIVGTEVEWPLRNLWLGVSVEDQQRANLRIPALLDTPAWIRWLSCEPLLGPINLEHADTDARCDGGIDWVVVGGESGHGARPMHPDWARDLRDQCSSVDLPFFFKQWGEHVVRGQMSDDTYRAWDAKHGSDVYADDVQWRVGKKAAGRLLDGRTWNEYPLAPRGVPVGGAA